MAAGDRAHHLGSAIAYAFGRTPLVLAAEARDLDELSGGPHDPRARDRHQAHAAGLARPRRRAPGEPHGGARPAAAPAAAPRTRARSSTTAASTAWSCSPTAPVRARRCAPTCPSTWPASTRAWSRRRARSPTGSSATRCSRPSTCARSCGPALARGAERAGRDAPPPIAGYVTCSVDDDARASAPRRRRDHRLQLDGHDLPRRSIASHGFEREAEAHPRGLERGRLRGDGRGGHRRDARHDRARRHAATRCASSSRERREGVFERTLLWPPATGGFAAAEELIEAFRA